MLRYDAGMDEAVRAALSLHLDWLKRLIWVSFFERVLTYAAAIGVVMMFAITAALGSIAAALLSVAGHVLLLLAVVVLVQRRFSTALLALMALSLLNYMLVSIAQYASLTAIGWVYLALGLMLLPFTIGAWLRLCRRWRKVGEYRERDDYRWLVTRAPLSLRWRTARVVDALANPDQSEFN